MKKKVSAEQIKSMLDLYQTTPILKDDFNLFIVNTPKGQVKYKTKLTKDEFLKEMQCRKKELY